MNNNVFITQESFQDAWLQAAIHLSDNHWKGFNLVVNIQNPTLFDSVDFDRQTEFSRDIGIRKPKDVAYTIFPYNLYRGNADDLFKDYKEKFYPWTRKRKHKGWGTYFYRMINYGPNAVNQLKNIIDAINSRTNISSCAYTIMIPYPGGETIRPLGSPCLNSICIQIESGRRKNISLLALYRNHEFLERSYGNYYGLCKLLEFICRETNSNIGEITCVSSHAFVISHKTELRGLLNE